MIVNGDLLLFFGGKIGIKPGDVFAYPLRRRKLAGMTFLTNKIWSKQWNMKDSLSFLIEERLK